MPLAPPSLACTFGACMELISKGQCVANPTYFFVSVSCDLWFTFTSSTRSHVLSKVCQYFTYKVRYTNSSTEIPDFTISREIALELLMAANFLDC